MLWLFIWFLWECFFSVLVSFIDLVNYRIFFFFRKLIIICVFVLVIVWLRLIGVRLVWLLLVWGGGVVELVRWVWFGVILK